MHSWSFTKQDFLELTEKQKSNLDLVYKIGEEKGYGLVLASMAVVENNLKKFDTSNNHICGILQVDIRYFDDVSCEALEDNHVLAIRLGLINYMSWLTKYTYVNGVIVGSKRSKYNAIRMYNVGYTKDPFGHEYVKRVKKVQNILKEYYGKN